MKSKLLTIVKSLLVISVLACAGAVLWAVYRYANTDPRFNVRQIAVVGLQRVEEDEILGRIKLRTDSNTNIFAVNMDEVRMRVEQIQWVRYASVMRVLPDRIIINVVERKSIGLARMQGHIYEFDAEAAVLDPDTSSTPDVPILVGLHDSDTEGNLRKIGMYRRAIDDLGAMGISEIIVNPSNEVSVVRNDDPVRVDLGVDNFKERWSHYLALKTLINTDFKDVVRVDLRFRNKVIVCMQGDEDGGKVIWDGKKKSL